MKYNSRYPYLWIDDYEEHHMRMKPPEKYKELVKNIDGNFRKNYEKVCKATLENFGFEKIEPRFLWDEKRGLHFIDIGIGVSYGAHFHSFKRGFEFKNVENSEKALALLNMISWYYRGLEELEE